MRVINIFLFNKLFIPIILLIFISNVNAASPTVRQNLIKLTHKKNNDDYTFSKCRALQNKTFEKNNNNLKILIIGDSQACDFINSMLENGYLKNHQVIVRYIPYRCQPTLTQFIEAKYRHFCTQLKKIDNLNKAHKQILQADLIIFAARWKLKTAQKLSQTIRSFHLKPHQKVAVIGNNNYGKINIQKYIHIPDNQLKTLQNAVDKTEQEINLVLKQNLPKPITFIAHHQLICGISKTCPIFTNELKLISYDGRHLTKAGARYVGRILYQKSQLKFLF